MSPASLLLALLGAVLKAGVLLGLAAGLVFALRRSPARTRHGVWAGALIGALLVPVLSPCMPDWSIGALPVPALSAERAARAVIPTRAARLGRPVTEVEPARSTAAEAVGRAPEASPAVTLPNLSSRAAAASPSAWLLGAWSLGCGAGLAWFLRALFAARRLQRRALPLEGRWQTELAAARRRVGVRRRVRLLGSAEISTPMTWGSLRPVILLPSRSRRWSEERRRIVLLHELVHIRRADWLVRLVARLVCSIYWLNPLVWVAARRLAVEQEIACDEEVVALGTRPSSYASHLLAIARTLGPAAPTPAHALDMARRSQMEGRLMSILDENRRLRSGRKLAVMALVVIAGLVPALAAIEPWSDEEASRSTSGAADPIRASVEADTEGLARALAELESLERQMAPFEAELEGLEAELEPIVSELEGIEIEMEPHQARLEAIEGELEPFEELLATIEREMEPLEDRLQAIESELEPFEDRLEAIESELEPLQDEMEALSDETEPLTREGAVDAVELERLSTLMQTVHQRMAPLMERIGATHEEMEPLYERMAEVHRELAPLHERMGSIHEQMRPVIDKMAAVHQELEPLHERLSGIHQQMEPVHDRMSAAHDRMAPIHERMGEHHRRMEPYHHKMGEIHERMRPLHEQMRLRHLELEEELVELVERMLVAELSGLTSAGTGFSAAATEIANAVSLRVDDGKLTIMSSAPRLREILGATLGGRSTVSEQEFAAAVERFVRALNDLEVEAP